MLYVLAAFVLLLLVAAMVLRPLLAPRDRRVAVPDPVDPGTEVEDDPPGRVPPEAVPEAATPAPVDDLDALIAERRQRIAERGGKADR